ncbi:MAG: HAMP domain-containing protein, partial [candidate division Zixibacteria bacterium]|nr:HAMP domain-containing protein [candidate division Zixibacteria bacterium]
ILIILALIATIWYISNSLKDFYFSQIVTDLQARAILVEKEVSRLLKSSHIDRIDAVCKELGRKTSTRITVINPNGLVLGDSDENPEVMDNHATRPEIMEAFLGSVGVSKRFSDTIKKEMVYVAIPIIERNEPVGVIRTSIPWKSIDRILGDVQSKMVMGGFVITVLVGLISLFVSRKLSQPLVKMRDVAKHFAKGELEYRLPLGGSEEMNSLAKAMNDMAAQLDDRIRTVITQRNEQNAVLSSMVEGVIAVDVAECLINLNQAAAEMLLVTEEEVRGLSIHDVITNERLRKFITDSLSSKETIEEEIVSYGEDGYRYLQVHGTVLRDGQGRNIGALVVLHDITRLRRLEIVRRDFVANVSHELRTPITSIKGFVETLLEGALEEPEDAKRFLGIILRQVDHMNDIIADLLTLSRLERDAERSDIELKESSLRDVVENAIQVCEVKASKKDITLELATKGDLRSRFNPALVEQAVVNLIDNAIIHSNPNSSIQVELTKNGSEIEIAVIDHGVGIEEKHIHRIFERFYLVDKARSRSMGGTGLGLSIVKHIALAHSGKVSVESKVGKGSTFRIHIPANIPSV